MEEKENNKMTKLKKKLCTLSSEELYKIYCYITQLLQKNCDFRMWCLGMENLPVIFDNLLDNFLIYYFPDDKGYYKRIDDVINEYNGVQPPDAVMIDIINDIVEDERLLEAVMIMISEYDNTFEEITKQLEINKIVDGITDEVYDSRRYYREDIECYTRAAVDKYGVIPLYKLFGIINYYDQYIAKPELPYRRAGSYPVSLFYDFTFIIPETIGYIVSTLKNVIITSDEIVLNKCFMPEYENLDIEDDAKIYRKYAKIIDDDQLDLPEFKDEFFNYAGGYNQFTIDKALERMEKEDREEENKKIIYDLQNEDELLF